MKADWYNLDASTVFNMLQFINLIRFFSFRFLMSQRHVSLKAYVCVLHMLWSHFHWAYFICSEYIQTITRIVWKCISTAADSCGPEVADGKQHSTLFYLWSEGDFLMWEFQKSQCNWAGGVDYTAFCFLVQSLHSTEMFCLVRMSTPLEPHCVQKMIWNLFHVGSLQ